MRSWVNPGGIFFVLPPAFPRLIGIHPIVVTVSDIRRVLRIIGPRGRFPILLVDWGALGSEGAAPNAAQGQTRKRQ